MSGVVHFTLFDDAEPICGAMLPEPPSRKPFSWPASYPRVTTRKRDVTCWDCAEAIGRLQSQSKGRP